MGAILIVDADNLGRERDALVRCVVADVAREGTVLRRAFIAGHASPTLSHLGEILRHSAPECDVTVRRSAARKESADILCAFAMGYFAASTNVRACYLLSYDKLVLYAATELVRRDIPVVVLSGQQLPDFHDGSGNVRQLPAVVRPPQQDAPPRVPRLPHLWIETRQPPEGVTGLVCFATPGSPDAGPLGFVGFPEGKSRLTMGWDGDIPLGAWDRSSKHFSLYSPHVEFRYDASHEKWTVLSLRGFRRGARAVFVDGRQVTAQSGVVPLEHGAELRLGSFAFMMHESQWRSYRDFCDPKDLIEKVERGLRVFAENFDPESFPEVLRTELQRGGRVDWDEAHLRHYLKALQANWQHPSNALLRGAVPSKSRLAEIFGSLIRIRNVAMHPSRPSLPLEDREKLAKTVLLLVPALGIGNLTSPPSTPSSPRSDPRRTPSPAPAATGTSLPAATSPTPPCAPLDPPHPPAEPPSKPTASSPSRPAE